MAKTAVAPQKKTRVIGPPVPFEVVSQAALNEGPSQWVKRFGSGKYSHYEDALRKLQENPSQALVFNDIKCRGQIASRAKKLGVMVEYKVLPGNKLAVRIIVPPAVEGDPILAALKDGPRTLPEIETFVRAHKPAASGNVANALQTLAKLGKVRLTGDSKWRLAA